MVAKMSNRRGGARNGPLSEMTKNEYQQQWRAKNPGYNKAWRRRNPGKSAVANRRFRMRHPVRVAESVRRYREKYPEKIKAARDRLRREQPEKLKAYRLKHLYGLTEFAYQTLLNAQGGVCAICKGPESIPNRRLGVDHCHKTGRVRGLLCDRCNVGLGRFKDDASLLKKAVAYLEES